MAVAAASFSTLMSEMSSGLMFSNSANFSLFALAMSKFCRLTCLTLPSTTISGFESVSVDRLEAPLSLIVEPEPRSPELPMMSRPAIRPCMASSIVVNAIPSTSFIEKF